MALFKKRLRLPVWVGIWQLGNLLLFAGYVMPRAGISLVGIGAVSIVWTGIYFYFLKKYRVFEAQEKLRKRFMTHESRRHFQVLQSLLYVEQYDEARDYLQQVTQNEF